MTSVCQVEINNGTFTDFLYNTINITDVVDSNDVSEYLLNFNYNMTTAKEVFCDELGQMNHIYVLEFLPQNVLSLYGCKELEVNGSMVKFEGVLVLIGDTFDTSKVDTFGMTRYHLNQTGIAWTSLKVPINNNVTKCTKLETKAQECKDKKTAARFYKVFKNSGVQMVPDFRFWIIMIVLKCF